MKYLKYEFFTTDEDEQQWLIALLAELPFEGFEQTNISVAGFIKDEMIADGEVRALLRENYFSHIQFAVNVLEQKNWNEEWEKNFQPVIIAGKVGIRAPFHQPLDCEIEMVIEPKMSFGTGHHATTAMMVEMMLETKIKNRKVLDIGCGTGVLAILAQKLGAAKVLAIDHEAWAVENAIENATRNNAEVQVEAADAATKLDEQFDLLLANINRNVIAENLHNWVKILNPAAEVLLSGFTTQDVAIIRKLCSNYLMTETKMLQRGEWVCIRFSK